MIETIPRMSRIPGIPKAHTGRVHDFFDRIHQSSTDVRVWNGELYFELHRGTYTTQARNKRGNRKSENAYRDAEFAATLGMLHGAEYPARELTEGWETILLNHFHDIIPGSSVGEVYRESVQQYGEVIDRATKVRDQALRTVAAGVDTTGAGEPIVVWNTLSFPRSELVAVAADAPAVVTDAAGNQVAATFADGQIMFLASDISSMGYAVYHVAPGQPAGLSPFAVDGSHVQTPFYEADLRPDGTFLRLYDKTRQREVLAEGQTANVLQFFEDKPANWEAWDVEPQYADKQWQPTVAGALSVVEDSSVRLVLACRLTYGGSTFDQRIVFYAHTPRIDFAHDVDWQDRKTLVKVAFPVNVRSSRATYEIAYGTIERPTHENTSWDTARFEVCGQRWADLSETGYGVSLLNDCKYGWDIHDNVMRLSLLRGPENPDPNADVGRHEYVYALFPHAEDWRNGTVQEGASLNTPLIPVRTDSHSGDAAARGSFASVDTEHVLLDTVKKAEDSDEMILRLYEAYGARGAVTLTLERPVRRAVETNLLEDEEGELAIDGSTVVLSVKPFEVKTVKVQLS